MGNKSSSSSRLSRQEIREKEAIKQYNIRVKGYNFALHGSYHTYIEWCQSMFQMDCIQKEALEGNNCSREFDDYGRRIY